MKSLTWLLCFGVGASVYAMETGAGGGDHNGDVVRPSDRAHAAIAADRAKKRRDLGIDELAAEVVRARAAAEAAHAFARDLAEKVAGAKGAADNANELAGVLADVVGRRTKLDEPDRAIMLRLAALEAARENFRKNLKNAVSGGLGAVVVWLIVRQFIKSALHRSHAGDKEADDIFDVE